MATVTGGAVQQAGGGVLGGVRVLGVREAIAALEGRALIARLWLGLEVHTAAESMATKAKANIHSISGNLVSGTRAEPLAPYAWNVVSSSRDGDNDDKNQKEYAGFVEFGTSKMEPRFYMSRAFAETKPEVVASMIAIAGRIGRL